MAPYIVIFTISIGLFWLSNRVIQGQQQYLEYIAIVLLCLLAGFRAMGIGTDTTGYLKGLYEAALGCTSVGEYMSSTYQAFTWRVDYVRDIEVLFSATVLIVTKLTGSIYCVQIAIELWIILPLYYAIKKSGVSNIWVSIFVFCMAFFNPSLNMMRQSVAMSIGVLGFEYWKENKKGNALICIIAAILFHETALVLLFIYWLYDYNTRFHCILEINGNVWRSNKWRFAISAGIGVAGLLLTSILPALLPVIGFSKYMNFATGDIRLMPNQILLRIPQLLLIVYSYNDLRQNKKDPGFYLLLQIYVVILSQLTSINENGARMAQYFAIFDVITIPLAIDSIDNEKIAFKAVRIMIIVFYMVYWWYYFVNRGSHQTIPYVFLG